MTDEELIAELREDAGRFGEAGETVWPGDVMLKAADAIERLTRERDEARARERMLLDRNLQLVIDADEALAKLEQARNPQAGT
jgi:hypothetical protein